MEKSGGLARRLDTCHQTELDRRSLLVRTVGAHVTTVFQVNVARCPKAVFFVILHRGPARGLLAVPIGKGEIDLEFLAAVDAGQLERHLLRPSESPPYGAFGHSHDQILHFRRVISWHAFFLPGIIPYQDGVSWLATELPRVA